MPRKVAFSGKKKREQLQAKKQQHLPSTPGLKEKDEDSRKLFQSVEHKPRHPPTGSSSTTRYALKFRAESPGTVERKKEAARSSLVPIESPAYLECQLEDFFNSDLDFPVRPPWDFKMSKSDVEKNENMYFMNYLKEIETKFQSNMNELSFFELNLETWRQFWRVLEMADILLCVVDIRFPPLLFPPKLYTYCKESLGKPVILILNKIDLAPAELVLAWEDYFHNKFPDLELIKFTSSPYSKDDLDREIQQAKNNKKGKTMKFKRSKGKFRMAAEAGMELYKTCEKIVAGEVDLSSWKSKILEELRSSNDGEEEEEEEESRTIGHVSTIPKPNTDYFAYSKKYSDGILTIGCIGQPNVGKSSVINALMGKKVVSVSRTPGHTKHFQTIFLTNAVRLCDCPGLIFPSKVPKELQVLCGSYPIAQLREPYSTVKYLAERIDLVKLLRIQHPEGTGEDQWSAFDICDGWALKRGYYTAKASRLDSYRGANHLLRLALDGRICLNLRPIGFTEKEEEFRSDPRTKVIGMLQGKSGGSADKMSASGATSHHQEYDEDDFNLSEEEEDSEDPRDQSGSESEEEEVEVVSKKPPAAVKNKFELLSGDVDTD